MTIKPTRRDSARLQLSRRSKALAKVSRRHSARVFTSRRHSASISTARKDAARISLEQYLDSWLVDCNGVPLYAKSRVSALGDALTYKL